MKKILMSAALIVGTLLSALAFACSNCPCGDNCGCGPKCECPKK